MINMGEIWQRGAKLGLIWTLIFFGVTGLVFLLMGMLGWSGALRALCAMAVGPILATGAIVGWWMVRRPSLAALGSMGNKTDGHNELRMSFMKL